MPPRKRAAAKPTAIEVPPVVDLNLEEITRFLVELLEHVTLRDAGETTRLRAQLTGEEVPDGDDEEDPAEDEGEAGGDSGTEGSP